MHRLTSGQQRAGSDNEGGFTLVELLVVCVILPLVIGAISVGILAVFQLNGSVSTRLSGSGDAQVVSSYYVGDVQNATSVTTLGTPLACGTSGTQMLGLRWSTNQTSVSYAQVQKGTTYSLVRYLCQNGNTTTPVTSTVVSHDAGTPLVAVTCSATASSCAASTSWIAASGVTGVKITITTQRDNYTYSVTAVPRAWNGSTSGATGPVFPPLLLLGAGTSVLTCAGNASIDVNGAAAINSTSNGSGSLTGNASFSAESIYTADTSNPAGAITNSNNATVTPPGTPLSGPPIPDPYAGLTPPSTSVTTYPTSSWSSNQVVTIQPGIYTSTISVSGNASVTLASGIYILRNGISVTGNGIITEAPGGVFFYVTGGQVNLSGNAGVTLQPLSSPPSPATNLAIWQVVADTQSIILTGNGSGSIVNGTIYAPGAFVGGSGNAALTAGAVLAKGLSCNGNGATTIG